MSDSRRGDPMIRAIVYVWVFGLLEVVELWGDHLHHWHRLGFWKTITDYFLLPIVILVWMIPIFRPKRVEDATQ
jgi:hypothetical protein